MIRTKKITYLDTPSYAIYFQNMTQHVKQIRLESQIVEEKNRNQSLQSFTSTISHEFRTPLSTSLMFLEQILADVLNETARRMIMLIMSQLNLLLSLVNDVLDIKMIEQGKFNARTESFSIKSVLNFIVAMFNPQSQAQQTIVSAHTVSTSDFQMFVNHGY